ncbi:ABC transporter substrate binding protein [Phormidium sp. FACHB-1136]|uniref:ABC transporter substrate binding protein n=1 Tax=Phormidium sp. FACHB-1136 TaxID=2692848 RepID=UPI0016863EEE|nr:ABC transporter substrate binding protein [Phormidium sp. FACHB-1136]MBD2425902.1 diguanylate cyclase [Phormidium sp. FACHB-1136]
MARKCIYYILLFCIGLACWSMLAHPSLGQDSDAARVLFINSYHRGYSWSDGIEAGLSQRLAESKQPVELSIEFLDSRRFAYGQQRDFLAQAMAVKYDQYRPDVVVVSDNAAFDFAMQYRQKLFADIPIVFCGYNNFRPEVLQGITNITGVNEEIAIMDTVEMALQIHPRTRTLAFIVSTGEESSQRIKDVAEETIFPALRQRFEVVVLADAPIEEIQTRLADLPANTLLFLSGQTSTQGDGRALTPTENGRLITGVSPFPAYTFWDFHMGEGAIGGHIITGPEQGIAAADLVLRILAGESADDIPVIMTSPTRNIFDYRVMRKFGVRPSSLPAGADIIHQPFLVWENYRWQVIGTISLVVLQALLIALLLKIARERRLALRALGKEQARLEERVEERTIALQMANRQLAHLSRTDALTELANRRYFDETLMMEFLRMQRCHHPLSLILLDVDHFKPFNDHYGHVIGDDCLRRIGTEIGHMVRHPPDLAARYGGEEFALILPETDLAGAKALAERLRRRVEELAIPHQFSRTQPYVTVSLGVVMVMAQDVPHAEDVIRLADQALYQAKLQGRNRTIIQAISLPLTPHS